MKYIFSKVLYLRQILFVIFLISIMFKHYFFIFILSCSSDIFADQDLLAMYRLAELNDPQLTQAQYRQGVADEIWWQSMGRLLPALSLSASSSWDHIDNKKNTFQN